MIFTSPSVLLILALAFVFQIAILLFARSKGIAIGRISTWGSPSRSEGEEVRASYIRSGIIRPAEHDSE